MKINYGVLFAGAAIGGAIGWYYMRKVQIPNAFAMGQANPTQAYSTLTPGQIAQLGQSPPLPSPPPVATVAGSAISGIGMPQNTGAQVGTGALLGRRQLLPVRYRGTGRHG
jgi:hypothetical protein